MAPSQTQDLVLLQQSLLQMCRSVNSLWSNISCVLLFLAVQHLFTALPFSRSMCLELFYQCRSLLSDSSPSNPVNTWLSVVPHSKHQTPICNLSSWLQAFGVFGLCQIYGFVDYLRSRLSPESFQTLFKTILLIVGSVVAVIGVILSFTGSILNVQ